MRAIVLFPALVLLGAAASASETISYTYDALGRLVQVSRAGTVNNNASECYNYDLANNRTNVTSSIGSSCTPPPSFAINDAAGTESAAGTITFTVTRAGSTSGSNSVNYTTMNNTALAGSDYTAKSGTLTFAAGVVTQTITVSLLDDATSRKRRDLYVNLSVPTGGATIRLR